MSPQVQKSVLSGFTLLQDKSLAPKSFKRF
nr:MAG TPA: hypothetical protein [Caudoviricetes sp.]